MNNRYGEPSKRSGARSRLSAVLERSLQGKEREESVGELSFEVQLEESYAWVRTPQGWILGLELSSKSGEWRVTAIELRPFGPEAFDPVVDPRLISEAIAGVESRASGLLKLHETGEEQLKKNGAFIRSNLAACADKGHRKTNFDFAAIAAAYAGEVQAGNRKPTQTLANVLNTSTAVVAQWVKEARKRRLLTPAELGRASGSLSPLGALYTSPDFPGFGAAWRDGVSVDELAQLRGVSVRDVWTGLDGEGQARNFGVWGQNYEERHGGSQET